MRARRGSDSLCRLPRQDFEIEVEEQSAVAGQVAAQVVCSSQYSGADLCNNIGSAAVKAAFTSKLPPQLHALRLIVAMSSSSVIYSIVKQCNKDGRVKVAAKIFVLLRLLAKFPNMMQRVIVSAAAAVQKHQLPPPLARDFQRHLQRFARLQPLQAQLRAL